MAGVHGAGGDAAGLRTFEDAKSTLYGTISAAGAALEKASKRRESTVTSVAAYLDRIQLDLSGLSVIHVTGTKGKGSTCAMVESVLRHHGFRTGLYTSPHLLEVTERVRCNGKPLTKEAFARYFFQVWDRLQDSAARTNTATGTTGIPAAASEGPSQAEQGPAAPEEEGTTAPEMPTYFHLLTLVGLWCFVQEGVDVCVLEVGMGGRFDATNVVPPPVACGVAMLDLDHTQVLGDTLDKIAWEKGGIFKEGCRAMAVEQPRGGMSVLREDHKPRTKYFLTTGGRVVRVDHDPDAGNRLIVPTEDELKTILYDQTDARNRGNGHRRRDNIDFVALHANRRPRRKGSKNGVGNNQRTHENNGSPVVVIGEEFPERHAFLSDRPHIRRERVVKSDRCLRLKANRPSPKHHDSGEEDDVSLFLDSFSASEMPGQHPAAAVETAVTRQSPPTSLCPDDGVLEGQARKAEAVVADTTQTTMEMSKPLAKTDLYSILAKAPPAELRSTASHRPVGGIGCSVDPTMSNKAGMKRHKREQGSLRRLASSVVVGGDERPAFEAALRLTPREEVGGYLKRDPLGDEVAELNAKLQESLRRVTQDTQRHKRRQPVGVARHYAAILGDRTRPLNIAKRLPTPGRDEDNIDDNDDTDATSSHDSRRCRATTGDRDDGRAADVFQRSCRGDRGRGEDSAESDRTSNSTRITTRHSSRKKADSETSPARGGRDSTSGTGLEVGRGGVRWLPDDEAELHSPVTGPPIGCRGNHDFQVPQQEQQPPDDVLDPGTTNSDCGEEPFEPADGVPESVLGRVAAAPSIVTTEGGVSRISLGVAMETKEHAGRNNGDGVISEREDYSSGHEATEEDGVLLSKDGAAPSSAAAASAAALRIETCWRGFVGRCVAKRLLRSGLLDALRSIGGGKISKVVSLTDVEREDRRGLNRALRLATQSRRQLPPQAHRFECVRFVKSLQRRRARVVEARKRRWIAERRQRRESAKNVPPGLLQGP